MSLEQHVDVSKDDDGRCEFLMHCHWGAFGLEKPYCM